MPELIKYNDYHRARSNWYNLNGVEDISSTAYAFQNYLGYPAQSFVMSWNEDKKGWILPDDIAIQVKRLYSPYYYTLWKIKQCQE